MGGTDRREGMSGAGRAARGMITQQVLSHPVWRSAAVPVPQVRRLIVARRHGTRNARVGGVNDQPRGGGVNEPPRAPRGNVLCMTVSCFGADEFD